MSDSIAQLSALPVYSEAVLAASTPPQLAEWLIRDEDRAPLNLVEACAQCGHPMLELLRGIYDHEFEWEAEPGRWWLKLHAAHILGLMPTDEAGLLLAEHMRRMAVDQDENLQEWLAGFWPVLFKNKPDAVVPVLRALAGDAALSWYIRHEAVTVLVDIARRQHPNALEEALAWVASLAENSNEDENMRLFSGALLLDFPRPQFRPLLEQLVKLQDEDIPVFAKEDVEQAYASMMDQPRWEYLQKDPWQFYAPAAIADRQERWEKEDREQHQREEGRVFDEIAMPYVRAEPKVGRNDPCPCGSGKKYKKCCINQYL